MQHTDIVNAYRAAIESRLADLFVNPLKANSASRLEQAARFAVLSGGRRIRPILVLLSCSVLGGRTADAMPLAVAIELVHAASLVLDDLPSMDDEPERRSQLALHRKEGEAVAILVAISLLARAFEMTGVFDGRRGSHTTVRLARTIGATGMCAGQFADLTLQSPGGEVSTSPGDVERLCINKTGLLMAAACEFGAVAASVGAAHQQALFDYGLQSGLAYQIRDDLQDYDRDTNRRRPNLAALAGPEAAERRASMLLEEAMRPALSLGIDTALLDSYAQDLIGPRIRQTQPAL